MRSAKKKIRSYIGLKRRWKLTIAALAAAGIVLGGLSLFFGDQPEPECVPFDPVSAEKGDYCCFDAVGISTWLFRTEKKNGSYTTCDTYYIAEDAGGRRIIVDLDMEEQTQIFSQQLYFGGGFPEGDPPKPHRLRGLAAAMREGDEVRTRIAEELGIDPGEEYEEYLGHMLLVTGKSPKKTGSAKLEGYAILAGMAAFAVFMGNMEVLSLTWTCLRDLTKYGRPEEAAEQLGRGRADDPIIVGDGYVFKKNKGVAVCPEMIKEAVCDGTVVSVKTRSQLPATILRFSDVGQARRFMEFVPLPCVRDDEIMLKTDSPEKYEYDY